MARYRRERLEGELGTLEEGAEGLPRLRKRRRGVALLPAMFTLGNCLCGFASVNYAARIASNNENPYGTFALAGYCIFAAMIFDMFDGFVARITRSASDFGAELDSLADMVSFGVAPAFLAIRLITELLLHPPAAGVRPPFADLPGPFSDDVWGRLFWVIAALYVSCTALRLARFNVINKHDVSSHMNFRGMPSPGAAAVVASSIIFFATLYAPSHVIPFNVSPQVLNWLREVFPYLLPLVLLVAALLMVSQFSYAHLINRFLRGRKKFRTVVFTLVVGLLIVAQPQITTLVAIYLYALSAPVAWIWKRGKTDPTSDGGAPTLPPRAS